MEKNLTTYNRFVHEYSDYSLGLSERAILRLFQDKWSTSRMLDIGIGTGRTTYTFAAIAETYVGIDYAEQMVKQTRKMLPESDNSSYHLCDARDLSRFYEQPFDFVLFSQNGLDSVGHEDRWAILGEVLKVLKPNGTFCFSGHTLQNFPFQRPFQAFRLTRPIKSAYYFAKRALLNARLAWAHKGQSKEKILSGDWAVLKTGDHDFQIDIYHVNPAFQIARLEKHGFIVDRVLDKNGNSVDANLAPDQWLYYVCKKPGS